MTASTLFFLFGLPIALAAGGGAVAFLNDWSERRQRRYPGE